MSKNFKIFAGFFVVIIILVWIIQANRVPIQNWEKNFEADKKSPFGLYVFNQEADQLFGKEIKRVNETPYLYFEKTEKTTKQNILIVQKNVDRTSWNKIFDKVKKGSSVFFIGEDVPKILQDTLNFRYGLEYYNRNVALHSKDQLFQKDSLILDKEPNLTAIQYIDKKSTQILGYSRDIKGYSKSKKPETLKIKTMFVKIKYGEGSFYIHTQPVVLTNYYLLKRENTSKYVESIFSYLPDRKTIWFTEVSQSETKSERSPLRFVYENPALKYAWNLLIFGLIIFALFNAKRKQRIVPIINPLKNTSVEFIKSIGNLYLQEGDLKNMMQKKAQYFLYKIRAELLIDTRILDEEFIEKIHQKTGTTKEKISKAIQYINNSYLEHYTPSKENLVEMNALLDEIINKQ